MFPWKTGFQDFFSGQFFVWEHRVDVEGCGPSDTQSQKACNETYDSFRYKILGVSAWERNIPWFLPLDKTLEGIVQHCQTGNAMTVAPMISFAVGGGGFADFHSAFSPKPEEQQAVGGGEKQCSSLHLGR